MAIWPAMCFFKAQGIQGTLLQGAETSIAADDIGAEERLIGFDPELQWPNSTANLDLRGREVERSFGMGVSEFRIHSYPEVI